MTQQAQPRSDLANNIWTPASNLWQALRSPAQGAPYAASQTPPAGDTFTVALDPGLVWPGPGPQTLTVQVNNTGPDPATVKVSLLQQATEIATTTQTVTGQAVITLQLPAAQLSAITDYTNCSVTVVANSTPASTVCCANLPATLHATIE
jgi:hypothetical protein